ncbi:MAG: hypothetical protein JWO95_1768 [Verrucomicrobiales bacterium]|nr:hypothetical protein [Verrucomicrobiales bacterium]
MKQRKNTEDRKFSRSLLPRDAETDEPYEPVAHVTPTG